jgi:hypothetical protein
MAWAKLHTDILGDPKLMRAARKGFKGVEFLPWIIAFAKGADDEGRLSVGGEPAEATDIAELIPCATRKIIAESLKSLEKIGVLTRESDGFLRFSQWERRSGTKPSDSKSAISERVKRHRAKEREAEVHDAQSLASAEMDDVTRYSEALQPERCNATEKKRREKEENKSDGSPPLFVLAWSVLPKRAGSNPRSTAEKAWRARMREGVPEADMFAGAERYRAFCEASGKVGTEFVMQGARFFGPNREFEGEWETPSSAIVEPIIDEWGVLTAYGERMTRPARYA